MKLKKILVAGSIELTVPASVEYFDKQGQEGVSVDNNMRGVYRSGGNTL